MRLLYVTPNPGRIGGVSRSVARITGQLRAAGHEVHLFCPQPAADPPAEEDPREQLRGLLTGHALQDWTDRTLAEADRLRPDLVVGFHGTKGAFCAVAAARLRGLPSVACLRGNDVDLDFFSVLRGRHLAFAVEGADAVTTVSSEMQRKVAAWLGVQATFIPNAVDRGSFYPDPAGAAALRRQLGIGEGPVVGMFGEFKPKRGLSLLAGLEEALASATTLLVGEIRSESRSEVPPWVRLLPWIGEVPLLRAAYTLCDLVLHPSLHDGMPNVVLEAMACERVVVASAAGGLPDLLCDGENGFLCREPGEWPRRVRQLLTHPRPEVGATARRTVPTPEQERNAFCAVFEEVLSRRPAHKIRRAER